MTHCRQQKKKGDVGGKCIIIMLGLVFLMTVTPCFSRPILSVAKRHALLIGVSDYGISGLDSLKGPKNDLRLIKKVLKKKLRFKEKDIVIMKGKRATHTRLEKEFLKLARNIGQGDFVYIHYSGHGSRILDTDGDEYPCSYDQTWVPYGSRCPGVSGKDRYDITDDELHSWLSKIYAKTDNVVFISDSCHSAGVTRGKKYCAAPQISTGCPFIRSTIRTVSIDIRQYPFSIDRPSMQSRNEFNNWVCIGSAAENGSAYEITIDGKTYGLFSWFWADALKGAQPWETWGDLFKRAGTMVTHYIREQHPEFKGDPDKPVFQVSRDIKPKYPRIPVTRVWRNGKKIRIEAGWLSGITVGSTYQLYSHSNSLSVPPPMLKITRVSRSYSEAETTGDFDVGDLVIVCDGDNAF